MCPQIECTASVFTHNICASVLFVFRVTSFVAMFADFHICEQKVVRGTALRPQYYDQLEPAARMKQQSLGDGRQL